MPFVFMLAIWALIPAGFIVAWLEDGLKKRKAADPDWTVQRAIVRWGKERTGPLTDEQRFGAITSDVTISSRTFSINQMRAQARDGRLRASDLATHLLELRAAHDVLDQERERRQIESGEILKYRSQIVLDFAPEGALVSMPTNHHGIVHFLRVHNGTINPDGSREEYAICVPNECRTVKAALAWTYGIEPDAYEEVVRT